MTISRRQTLIGAGALALAPLGREPSANEANAFAVPFDPALPLPHKSAFFPLPGVYLNSASQHPLSRGARAGADAYLNHQTMSGNQDYSMRDTRTRVLENYARLINASIDEIFLVQSTTAGENLVLNALDIPDAGGRIVTDALHFFGSFPLYGELAGRGMDVVTLRPTDGRIDMAEFEAAVTADTRLVAVSSVSTFNGYEHDLKAVCEIAHARDALVYADVIHGVGAVPFDVRETGVDFCSSASYKWLMGDFGMGFLYVRGDRLERIERPWVGYFQANRLQSHVYPGDLVGEYELENTTRGHFAMGTMANAVAAQLDYSLQYLLDVGVERIQAYRQPLMDRMQEALPELGYASLTPRESRTPLASFACENARERIGPKLREAGVTISVYEHRFRVSASVFNGMDDIEYLLEVLS